MPRPKKADQKPVEKPKAKGTAKRRKDKEEDADDLEEFEAKPEKKLKVESQDKGKAKIAILTLLDQRFPGDTSVEVHSFKDLASALKFRKGLIKKFEDEDEEDEDEEEDDEEDEEEEEDEDDEDDVGGSGNAYFNKKVQEHFYDGECSDGSYSIRIKELTVDEFLKGKDLDMILIAK